MLYTKFVLFYFSTFNKYYENINIPDDGRINKFNIIKKPPMRKQRGFFFGRWKRNITKKK